MGEKITKVYQLEEVSTGELKVEIQAQNFGIMNQKFSEEDEEDFDDEEYSLSKINLKLSKQMENLMKEEQKKSKNTIQNFKNSIQKNNSFIQHKIQTSQNFVQNTIQKNNTLLQQTFQIGQTNDDIDPKDEYIENILKTRTKEYTTENDLKLVVGTYNVNQKVSKLTLSKWLYFDNFDADIYVIGLQGI
jgi:hypothetical protein